MAFVKFVLLFASLIALCCCIQSDEDFSTVQSLLDSQPKVDFKQRRLQTQGRTLNPQRRIEVIPDVNILTTDDMHLVKNVINTGRSSVPRVPVKQPVESEIVSDDDLEIIKNVADNKQPTEALETETGILSDDEMKIIQSLLNSETTTTTTRRMPSAGRRVDNRMRERLFINIDESRVAPDEVLVQLPKGQLGFVPQTQTQQTGGSQIPLSIPKPLESPVASRRLGAQRSQVSSTLRDKLMGRFSPLARSGAKENPLLIDNMIMGIVQSEDTTTTTTTLAPRPIPQENYCLGLEFGSQIAHPKEPRQYIVCQMNGYLTMNCPSKLVFNPYLNRCDRSQDEPGKACLSSPCLNDGECVDTENYGFVCKCQNGFSGPTCDRGNDPCLSNPCSPNGACNTFESFNVKLIKHYCLCDGGNSYGLDCDENRFENPCITQHSETYHASDLHPSLFIQCEDDSMNMKSCHEPLVWSQSFLTCVSVDSLQHHESEGFEFVEEK